MKSLDNLINNAYREMFYKRCDKREGIEYFDEHHFKGLFKDIFEFENDNGFTLRGGYYHYKNYDKDTLIILCHGMGGGHQAYMKEIEYIARNGYKVLSYDYQGTIFSDGDKLDGPSQAMKDMDKCVNLIKDKYKHIYLVGHSWGSWVAQGVAGIHKEIEKVVLLAPLNNFKTLLKQYMKGLLVVARKGFLNIERKSFPEYVDSSMQENINREGLKALVIQSDDDKLLHAKLNIDMVEKYCTNKDVEFIHEQDKNHNPTYTKEAVKLLTSYLHKLGKCKYVDEARQLAESVNWDKLCELDEKIMDKIIEFLKK